MFHAFMRRFMLTYRLPCLALGGAAIALSGCENSASSAEIAAEMPQQSNIKLNLPAIPKFELPPPHPDGTLTVPEIRLKGRQFLNNQEVRVRGYVIWQYDCAVDQRRPNMSDKELAELLIKRPDLCEIPSFHLGHTKDTSHAKAIHIVEVPRPPRPDEKKTLSRKELKAWPKVPTLAVGDEVIVTGTWALRSPKGAANSEGLLVYENLENISNPSAKN